MTDERFCEVGQALDDFYHAVEDAKYALAMLNTLVRHDAFLMPQNVRDAAAALDDAQAAFKDIEPCDDEFDDEDGEEGEANYGATSMHNSCDGE